MGEDFESDSDLAAAVGAILDQQDAPEAAQPAAPQTPEIQPQAAPEAGQPTVGVNASEEAQAPVVETTAPVAAEAPKPLLATPEVAQKQGPEPSASPEADAARNQTIERAHAILQRLEIDANRQFADIKGPADVAQLMRSDPARYNELVIAQNEYQQALWARNQAQQEAFKAYEQTERQKLHKAIPDLADPEKGKALAEELRAYAKSQGIPDSRQARSADEVIRLHAEMKLAKEVAVFRAEKAKQEKALEEASKKAAKAPPVQQPGTQREVNKNEKLETDFERFSKSGKSDDLAHLLQHIL